MIMLENQRWIIDAVNEHKEYLDKIWFISSSGSEEDFKISHFSTSRMPWQSSWMLNKFTGHNFGKLPSNVYHNLAQ